MAESHRATDPGDSTLTAWMRRVTGGMVNRTAVGLVRLGITPNGLTITGLLLAIMAALLAAQGKLTDAGLVYLLGGPFDALDGAVARVGGKSSAFGAVLDSTLDRYGEALLLTGIGYALTTQGNGVGVVLAFLTLLGSVMVSYTRARSEGLGIDNKGGLFTRVERIILLGLGLMLGLLMPVLWLLAILTHITVAQRLWHVYRASQTLPPD